MTNELPEFLERPGCRERHLKRRCNNPLFGERAHVSTDELQQARQADDGERVEFYQTFQQVLEEISKLAGNVDSAVILELKQRVDRQYEQCCGLAGDNEQARQGLERLQQMIMQAIAQGAGDDPVAQKELADEAAARQLHSQLLQQVIVDDLLRPDTPLAAEDLLPSLLSEAPEGLAAALQMFDAEQLAHLFSAGESLLAGLEQQGVDTAVARERLDQIRSAGT